MKKLITQGFTLFGLFFLLWFALSQVDWLTLLRVDWVSQKTEEKLGNLYWDFFRGEKNVVGDKKIVQPIDSMVNRICTANGINPKKIKVHIVNSEEINAFALPDRHLVIYTGLLKLSDNESEVCGIIGHELAHMEKNHVMKKLIKEIGLTTLLASTTGGNSVEFIKKSIKVLSSSAYDRNLESEADLLATDYMYNAQLDPSNYAKILKKLADIEPNINKKLTLINSHPDTYIRVDNIINNGTNKNIETKQILASATWSDLKKALD